jgi:predicted carbohydrate-binding protein with CBM48
VTDMRDELLERVVGELQALPPVDEGAVGRIVRAAAADAAAVRGAPRPPSAGTRAVHGASWWQSRIPLAAAAVFALAAGVAGYAVRGGGTATRMVATDPAPAESLTLFSAHRTPRTGDVAVPTQFVLDAPRASHVALVGDFNAWDATTTPLARVSSSRIWTVTVLLAPGRHTYAFMIDGTAWTLDPRAPAAQDLDFGTPSSVVLVGAP